MEIHAPHEPITSWKDTVKHLTIITVGVLIALALEGVVSWADHRLLVREAVANLTSEIRNNRKELDGMFPNLAQERKDLEHADEIARLLLEPAPLEHLSVTLVAHGAELRNAAVTTSEITGAFGYMDYGVVNRYAFVYDLQAQFMRLQEREGQHFSDVFAFVRRIAAPARPSHEAVDRWRAQIDVALAGITLREEVGRQLLQRYDELLSGK